MIPLDDYKKIMASIPILCVDIVLQNPEGQYLLVKRANEPLKGDWWVIGGRVLKGEKLEDAALRKLKEEANIEGLKLEVMGIYQDFFDRNSLEMDTLYHTVSIVFRTQINSVQAVKLDSQSHEWTFAKDLPKRLTDKCIWH